MFFALLLVWAGVATAQKEAQSFGDALNVAEFDPIDANGINLLSGRFNLQSPILSMGGADAPTAFYFTWSGSGWLANTPHLWLDKDYNVIIEADGGSDEFTDPVKTGAPSSVLGDRYVFTHKRPNVGATLSCYYKGGLSGRQWITQCSYTSRNGVTAEFYGVQPSNGGYPSAAQRDYDAYGNAGTYPTMMTVPARGKTNYMPSGSVQTAGLSNGGQIKIDYPEGTLAESLGSYYGNSVRIRLKNVRIAAPEQNLWIVTDNLNGSNNGRTYLRPKDTHQTFTDPLGRQTRYQFNGSGDMVRITTAEGVITELEYDASHRVNVYKRNGKVWHYDYDFSDTSKSAGKTTVVDPANGTKLIRHLAKPGPATSVQDENQRTTAYAYDSRDRLTSITAQEGNITTYEYDATGNMIRTIAYPRSGMADAPLETNIKYGNTSGPCNAITCNKPRRITDPRSKITEYTYDGTSGLVDSVLKPADDNGVRARTTYFYVYPGYYDTSIYDTRPMPRLSWTSTCRTQAGCDGTADEVKTEYDYGFGGTANGIQPKLVTRKLGSGEMLDQVVMSYDTTGNLVAIDGPMAGNQDTTQMRYDVARQKIGTIKPDPDGAAGLPSIATRTTYTLDGQVRLVEQGTVTDQSDAAWLQFAPDQRSASRYDGAGRLSRVVTAGPGADGNLVTLGVTDTGYDSVGRVQCVATRMNQVSFPVMDASGDLYGGTSPAPCTAETVPEPTDRITKQEYDPAGQLMTVYKAYGTALQQIYASYQYSPNGKQTSVTDANGNKATMDYDGFDRQIEWRFPDKTSVGAVSATDYEAYTYDANGNRASLRKRDGQTILYSYDALNRMTLKDIPGGTAADVYYGYDLRDLQIYARFGSTGGDGVTQAYDGLGRLSSSSNTMGGTSRTLSYQYDADGNRARITHPDGVYFDYGYDGLDRMTTASWKTPTGAQTPFYTIQYDNQGRRASTSRGPSSTGYGYDAVSRLTTLTQQFPATAFNDTATFAYNPASQIVGRTRSNVYYAFEGYVPINSRAYATNGLNQYTSGGQAVFSYDANGNLTSDGSRTFGYDVENRLVSASPGDQTGGGSVQLSYDPLGRLYRVNSPRADTRFLYDGDALVAEYDGYDGRLLRRYAHGADVDEAVLWDEGSALNCTGTRFLHGDHQGSIVAMQDCQGNAPLTNTYDAYGIPRGALPGSQPNYGRFQYTGQAWIRELGMYHYKARMYSPLIGRFLQTDPIGYDDQVNLYAYVANDPVNGRDPSGLQDYRLPPITATFDPSSTSTAGSKSSPFSVSFSNSFSAPPLSATMQFRPALPQNDDIVVTAKKYGQKALQCAADHYGLGALGIGGAASGANALATRGKFGGAIPGTSVASRAASAIFGDAKLPFRVPTLVGFPLVGEGVAVRFTSSIARVAGRGVPVLGWALLAYDVGSIAICTASE